MRHKGNIGFKLLFTLFAVVLLTVKGISQRYLSDFDSSLFLRDTVRPLIKKFENLRFSGYFQGQYQVIGTNGAKTYGGGDFSDFSKSRFMIRRARMRMDYLALTHNKLPKALFTFQIDATERSVRVRDMFIRLYETKKNLFALTTGVFARPFGFEVNLSSSYRETPERGRMSQELVPSERDLGVMVSYEPQRKTARNHYIRIDAGIFNGPGLAGTTDFDNVKDIISRIIFKPLRINQFEISGSLGYLHGGWRQVSKFVYETGTLPSGDKSFIVDSAITNIGKTAPRQYYGADMQLKWLHKKTTTEIRAEFWTGKQSGTPVTTVSPGTLPTTPTYIRQFNGAFFYFIQDIISNKTQLLVKYDWYDPDKTVAGKEIGKAGTVFSEGDIKYSTLGIGLSRVVTSTVRFILYYEIVTNESTALAGYTKDLKDNLLTCRLQFRF